LEYWCISKSKLIEIDWCFEKSIYDPEEDESTPLGKVPHSKKKGSINPGLGSHGWNYNYSLVRENLLVVPKNKKRIK
jgi:hypothetical protein